MRHQPEGLDQLQLLTKFTKKELQSLYRGFKNVNASMYAHFLFNAFDLHQSGAIRFEDFVIGLSVLLRGT
ncbi:hypothetical protein E2320_006848, partial [Naja naja]